VRAVFASVIFVEENGGGGLGSFKHRKDIGQVLMIKRYSDHAANERTFLAWVRASIATMAFGFLIERFDLFIRFAAPRLDVGADSPQGRNFADLVGFGLVVLGMAMIAVAALRFFRTAKQIDSEETEPGPGVRFDLTLAALLVLLGCSLLLYLPHVIHAVR
jgi:putative membrane protein